MNKKIIIAIIASVVALAIVITGVILLLSSGFSANPNPTSSEQDAIVSNSNASGSSNNISTNSNNDVANNSSAVSTENEEADDSNVTYKENVPSEPAFYIADTTCQSGDKIKVPVKVVKNPGFMAFMINFEYDTSVLKYTGYSKGNVLSSYDILDNNGVIKFLALEDSDVKKDGTIVYLEFDVLPNAKGETEIKLNVPKDGVANYNEQFVALASQNGKVTIK